MAKKTKGLYKRGNVWWMTYVDASGVQQWESTRSKSKTEAEYILSKLQVDVKEGKEPGILEQVKQKASKHTFEDLCKKYMAFCQNQKDYKNKSYLIDQLKSEFIGKTMRQITLLEVEEYQSRMQATDLKPATVNRRIACLKNMMKKAKDWGMIEYDALLKIREVKQLKENNQRLRYLSIEECKNLIDHCADHIKPIVTFALNTGMRKGEILSLTWDRVDLQHDYILLRDSDVKNGCGRQLPINQQVKKVLREQLNQKRENVSYVFYNPIDGKNYTGIYDSFINACNKSQIDDFHFHDLRHTFASQCVMNGVDIPTLQKLLGHKTIQMTMRYAHLSQGHLNNAVKIVGNLFGNLPT